MNTNHSLDAFFKPRGVAIIGASSRAGSPGYQIVQNAAGMNFPGKIYPVNPTADEILGLKCYKSILDIPGDVDMALMMLPSAKCVEAAGEIAARKKSRGDISAVIVGSTGFAELGTAEGREREEALLGILKAQSIRVIGPNCVGVVDTYNGLNTTFSVLPDTRKGGVSIISQSGAFATSFLRWARGLGQVGISKFISVGNMADVDVIDLLEYLALDETTKAISLYLEGTAKARKLIETAAAVAKTKPIVTIKSGKTELGSRVARSHTGSIAGNDAIYDGALRQAGVIRAASVAEYYHTSRAFDKLPLPRGNRVCIVTVVGGPSTICVDELSASGVVQMACLSEELKTTLRKILNPSSTIGNPDGYIDMTASVSEQLHHDVLRLLLQEPGIDGIIFLTSPPGFTDEKKLAAAVISAYESFPVNERKPLLSVMLSGTSVGTCRSLLEEAGLPTFEYPEDAARVMANMIRYSQYRSRSGHGAAGQPLGHASPDKGDLPAAAGRQIIAQALGSGRTLLPEHEAYRLCGQYGIPSPASRLAAEWEQVAEAAESLGYPLVLKIVSPDISHKSDVGGVVLGINTPDDLKAGHRRLLKGVREKAGDVRIDGILVQKAMPRGVEVVVGAIRNDQFGPVVMFGSGGILIEVFKDVSFRLAPLDREEALRQIRETKAFEILKGVRGAPPCDIDAVADLIVNAGRMIAEIPEIRELDFNPILVYPDGCLAVDARIVI